MSGVGTYSFTHPSLSAFVRECTDHLKRDSPHDSQISAREEVHLINLNSSSHSGINQGSGGGSTSHNEINESFQPPLTSQGHEGVPPPSTKDSTEFQCTRCPTRCTQKRVLERHYREKHQPRSNCSHLDCNYKWTRSRESEYRKHLRKKHRLEDGKINKILGRPPRRRRGSGRVIESDLSPHFSPPPIERELRDRRSLAEPQQRPRMLPLPAAGKYAHHASPPLIPSVTYNPRFGRAKPEVTTTDHEDSSALNHLAVTHAPSGLVSREDFALLGGYHNIHGWFRLPSVQPGISYQPDFRGSYGFAF